MRSVDEDNSAESHNVPVIIHEPERRETAQTQDEPQELLSEPQVTIYTGDSVIGDTGNEQAPQESSAANLQAKDVLGDITNIVNNYTLADEDIQDHGTAIDSQGPENHPVDDFVESFASVQLPNNEPTVRSTFDSKFWGSWQTTAHNLHDRVSTLLEAVYQQFCLLLIKLATRYPKFGILLSRGFQWKQDHKKELDNSQKFVKGVGFQMRDWFVSKVTEFFEFSKQHPYKSLFVVSFTVSFSVPILVFITIMSLISMVLFFFYLGAFFAVGAIASIFIIPLMIVSLIFAGGVVICGFFSNMFFKMAQYIYDRFVLYMQELLRNLADQVPPSVGVTEHTEQNKNWSSNFTDLFRTKQNDQRDPTVVTSGLNIPEQQAIAEEQPPAATTTSVEFPL